MRRTVPSEALVIHRWHSPSKDQIISTVAPGTAVQPEIVAVGAKPPSQVEICRTYEPIFRRILQGLRGKTASKVIGALLVDSDPSRALYEQWTAQRREPFKHPTLYVFKSSLDTSYALHVTPALTFKTTPREVDVNAADVGGISVKGGTELEGDVAAPDDPDVELLVVSPHQDAGGIDLYRYAMDYVAALEREFEESEEFSDIAHQFAQEFKELYAPFLEGTGMIYAEVSPTLMNVGPEKAETFSVTLHVERPGPMMLAICAYSRGPDFEGVTISDLLPLIGEEG